MCRACCLHPVSCVLWDASRGAKTAVLRFHPRSRMQTVATLLSCSITEPSDMAAGQYVDIVLDTLFEWGTNLALDECGATSPVGSVKLANVAALVQLSQHIHNGRKIGAQVRVLW